MGSILRRVSFAKSSLKMLIRREDAALLLLETARDRFLAGCSDLSF